MICSSVNRFFMSNLLARLGPDFNTSCYSNWWGTSVARALTDHAYCCYLSDLAVDAAYQKQGVGHQLISRVRDDIGENVTLILLSAPSAMAYYPKVGFSLADNAYVIRRKG